MAQDKSHTWVGTLEQHVHLHAGHTILFSLWFYFSGKWKLQTCPGKTPAMLYSWNYLVVPNVTGVYSPAPPKESKLPPDWTVWRQELCSPSMALHCWTLVTAGGPSIAIHTTALWADFKLWSKKERKDAHYLGDDKQNTWHYYSSTSVTIVHFFLRGSGVTYSILLSLILCFSVFWDTVTFNPSTMHVLYILCEENVFSFALPSLSSFKLFGTTILPRGIC